ncbi:diphthamide synthesis protein [Candidatus Pacearchaeota archaeon]|nr:diphthamide synthesis protein [Candidatus Pacearchaeota archaeon]
MVKTIFVPAKSKTSLNKFKIKEISKKLPKEIVIAYSIQYQKLAFEIKKVLTNHNILKIVQVLGCSQPKFPKNTKAVLLIGSGRFHAISLAYETKLPIYILEKNQLTKISKKDIELYEKKNKASYLKFLNEDNVGLLISTKPGQENLQRALNLKKKLKKNSYLFISNAIDISEFENFGLDCWVNTACPRLDMDSSVINISRLLTKS